MRFRLNWKAKGAVCFAAVLTTIDISSAATMSGQVQQSASPGQPVANSRMTLFTPSLSFFRETRSNSLGAYTFGNVPNGTYQLGCAALRFGSNRKITREIPAYDLDDLLNVLIFCDGHAETSTPDKLGYRILPDGAYVDLLQVDDPPSNRLFSGTGRDDNPPELPR